LKERRVRKYNLTVIIALTIIPIIGIFGTLWYAVNNGVVWQEPVLLIFFWIFTGLGITAGYHRLFSHRSYKAHPILEWFLTFAGAAALQNSTLKWCSDHRRHHNQLDTDKDPYSITKGFFHAHIGWIFEDIPEPIDKVKDLEAKAAIRFQYKYYIPLFAVFGVLLPIALGTIWGRPLGALFWGVFLRITLVHHFTYFINSLCHYIGKKPYDHKSTSRDTWYISFLTFGEGFHNYHHKFQWDYRNGVKWYNFDPSKWIIRVLSYLRVTYNLRKAPKYSILKAQFETINQKFKKLSNKMKIDKNSYGKMNKIMNEAFEKLNSWKMLEKKYLKMKKYQVNKNQILFYQQKKKIFEIELKSSLSSLLIILVNLKKTI